MLWYLSNPCDAAILHRCIGIEAVRHQVGYLCLFQFV